MVYLYNHLSQKMTELGRLGENCLYPRNWEALIVAIKTVAGFDEDTNTFQIPSLALKVGHSISKSAKYLR